MIAVDLGFGWTKCIKEGDKLIKWKFPTWVAYWSGEPITDVKTVLHEGREYVVGDVARYVKHRVEIADFSDLLRWTPVILKHVFNVFGEDKVIGGVPPKYYAQYKQDLSLKIKLDSLYVKVYPQGFGILVDVEDALNLQEGETVLILDVGFNTVDYLLVRYDGGKYTKIAGGTLEGMGVLKAVEVFRTNIGDKFLREFSRSQLLKVFEKGIAKVEGKEIDLVSQRNKALDVYSELLKTRLKAELSVNLLEADRVVLAGGGAYFLKDIRHDVVVPPEPEFSNVRGYLKAGA